MIRTLKFLLPNLLGGCRLLAGPIYLAWGTAPAPTWQLAVLLLAAGSDLIDGRIARAWEVTSTFGRFLDASADRLLILCVLLKLAFAEIIPGWVAAALVVQHLLLAGVFLVHIARVGTPPKPDFWAKLGAGIAAVAGIVGLSSGAALPTVALLLVFMAANLMYLVVVGVRAFHSGRESVGAGKLPD